MPADSQSVTIADVEYVVNGTIRITKEEHERFKKLEAENKQQETHVRALKASIEDHRATIKRLEAENKAMMTEVRNQKDYVLLMHDRLSIPCRNMNRMSIELRDARKEIAAKDAEIARYKNAIEIYRPGYLAERAALAEIKELEAKLANEQLWWAYAIHPEGCGMVALGERRMSFEAEGKKLDRRWKQEAKQG